MDHIVARLCEPSSLKDAAYAPNAVPMPSLKELEDVVARLKITLFPGYYEAGNGEPASPRYLLASTLDSVFLKLSWQIFCAFCFGRAVSGHEAAEREQLSRKWAFQFIESLPHIRGLLTIDIKAAYEGDPAATGIGEILFCYPFVTAMIHYRVAHELLQLGVPLIPRILCESAHAATGIDIHPGARIGEGFFIDHGTGVVIGETSVIGNYCRIYQGVTLGARSFPRAEDGALIRGARRHPRLGDRVTVYAGASILGNISIGSGAVIGANMWVTSDVPENTRLTAGGMKKNHG
jgi:serine O-acetyltransferase